MLFFQADCYFSWTWESSWRSSLAIIRLFKHPISSFSGQENNTWKALIFLHPPLPQPKVIFYWVRLLSLTSHFRPFFVFHVGHAFYTLSLHSFCHSSMSNNRCSSKVKKKKFSKLKKRNNYVTDTHDLTIFKKKKKTQTEEGFLREGDACGKFEISI